MKRTFTEALKNRRTYYSISNQSPISDGEIEQIVNFAVTQRMVYFLFRFNERLCLPKLSLKRKRK